ncbi:glutamate synthase-related protein [Streptomyces sp. NPDC001941]|uniref:glutamate synthase-related protein n=1 Tax=Streptomyces sp. NPDC001941 TaxID=3154659 RepID=UPI00332CE09B
MRDYPVLGYARFLLEAVRPELQQYFVERHFDGRPFDRDTRSIARVRGVPQGETVVSPPYHREFTTPRELVRFLARMREPAGASRWASSCVPTT